MKTKILIVFMFIFIVACGGEKMEESKKVNKIAKHINVEEMRGLLKDGNFIILDVRTESEYKSGHIENSKNIDFYSDKFIEKIKELNPEKSYIIYCRSGNRSSQSLEIMKKLGFNEIYNLKGGIGALGRANYPLKY